MADSVQVLLVRICAKNSTRNTQTLQSSCGLFLTCKNYNSFKCTAVYTTESVPSDAFLQHYVWKELNKIPVLTWATSNNGTDSRKPSALVRCCSRVSTEHAQAGFHPATTCDTAPLISLFGTYHIHLFINRRQQSLQKNKNTSFKIKGWSSPDITPNPEPNFAQVFCHPMADYARYYCYSRVLYRSENIFKNSILVLPMIEKCILIFFGVIRGTLRFKKQIQKWKHMYILYWNMYMYKPKLPASEIK
jgi:hypothetical protein